MASVYALVHTRLPQTIRYIGQTRLTLDECLRRHLKVARGRWGGWRLPVYRWIRSLLRAGLAPAITVLEDVPANQLDVRERYWIARFMPRGKLLNPTAGGKKGPRGWHPSIASRRKMALAKLGKKQSPATRLKRGRSIAATWKDPIVRAKRLAGMIGHTYSKATLRRMSLAAKGRVISVAQRRKISQTLIGRRITPEQKQRQIRAIRRAWRRPEVRVRHQAACRKNSQDAKYRLKMSRITKAAWKLRKS